MASLHSCNVLNLEENASRLWQYAASNGQVTLTSERAVPPTGLLPARIVGKKLRSLWQTRINISWLPAEHVFLRVLQLPKCDFAEMVSMIEFQLEKISPMPVAQIVWTVELVPHKSSLPNEQQTVIVVIAERQFVEAHLGRLERQGYLADRLEVPFLHQLLSTEIKGDGVWLYPHTAGGVTFCLAAWWCSGTLHNLSLIHLTTADQWAMELDAELKKAAWGGELEGWLTSSPRRVLVADAATAEVWAPVLNQFSDQVVEVIKPLDTPALAALNARRVARDETKADMLPAEHRARYRQQFIDRLWMRGLGAVFALYVVGVLIYMGAVQALRIQNYQLEKQVETLATDYKKALELKARIAVQEQQIGLQFAALDSWKAASETLPSELTLTSFSFSKGKLLALQGTTPESQAEKVTDYREALGKFTLHGSTLFAQVGPHNIRVQPAGVGAPPSASWSFTCELKGPEQE